MQQQPKVHPLTGAPLNPVFVSPKTGRQFWPILGASEDDPNDPPKDPDDLGRTFTQEELNAKLTEEKRQGKRSGAREVMETLGFSTLEEAKTFIEERKAAEEAAKTADEKRAEELAARERQADEKIATATARERSANIRASLAAAGSTGENLGDAARILEPDLADNADEDAITAAVDALKKRREELFTAPVDPTKRRAPLPGGRGPKERTRPADRESDGSARARDRGFIKD